MTTLGPSLTVAGDITSQEDITVHGTVKGTITMQNGALVIAPQGRAEAAVEGSTITVQGAVSGDLCATGRLELTDSAKVEGTIITPSLVLREGAVFNGMVDMSAKKGAAAHAGSPKVAVAEPAKRAG
jgi:cytoskeletal protein CcmA (bactofilin family)